MKAVLRVMVLFYTAARIQPWLLGIGLAVFLGDPIRTLCGVMQGPVLVPGVDNTGVFLVALARGHGARAGIDRHPVGFIPAAADVDTICPSAPIAWVAAGATATRGADSSRRSASASRRNSWLGKPARYGRDCLCIDGPVDRVDVCGITIDPRRGITSGRRTRHSGIDSKWANARRDRGPSGGGRSWLCSADGGFYFCGLVPQGAIHCTAQTERFGRLSLRENPPREIHWSLERGRNRCLPVGSPVYIECCPILLGHVRALQRPISVYVRDGLVQQPRTSWLQPYTSGYLNHCRHVGKPMGNENGTAFTASMAQQRRDTSRRFSHLRATQLEVFRCCRYPHIPYLHH